METPELFMVLISALLHAVWSLAIKGSRSPLAFNLLQALANAALFLLVVCFVDLSSLSPRFWLLAVATGVAHALYLLWLSLAFERGDLTLVYPIARSTPAFLPFFAVPLLGESIGAVGALGIATVVAGMWAVQLGGSERRALGFKQPGMLYAYLTLAATIAYGLTDKEIMTELTATAWRSPIPRPVFAYFALWFTCSIGFVPLAFRRLDRGLLREVARAEWRTALGAGALGLAGYGLILAALETAQASYVVAARQSSVLFVLAIGVLALGERPGAVRSAGAFATVAGVVLIALAR